jgi:hypothetical protein
MRIPWYRTRITHLSRKGQLTLPAQLMRELHLIPGQTQLVLELRGRTLRLVPLKDESQGAVGLER